MQKIKSLQGAERVADEIMERMEIGQTIEGNCFKIRKVYRVDLDFTYSLEFKVSGPAEHIYSFFTSYGYTIAQIEEENMELSMSTGGLAHFIFFPNRKAINDALPVFERQLEESEEELFARTEEELFARL